MIVVDTTIWVDFLHQRSTDQTVWLRRQPLSEHVAITELILTEVLQGIRLDSDYTKALALLSGFRVIEATAQEIAVASAEHYRWLRKRGITIRSTIDCLTATFCIREGFPLLHNDRDFDPFEKHLGLKVIHPQA